MRRPSAPTLALIAILTVGAVARASGLAFGLPNIDARPDEVATVLIASGLLFNGLNPHFFHWPSLLFYTVAIIYRLIWQVGHWRGLFQHKYEIATAVAANPTPYFMVPRVLSVVTGTLAIWFVYRVTRDLIDRTTALVAAFFLAVAFLHVRDSHFGVTDVPTSFLAIAAMLPFARAHRDPLDRRPWTSSGILTGLAASMKYGGGVLVVVAVAIAVMAWRDAAGPDRAASRRRVFRHLVRFGVAAALAFVATTPFAVLDAPEFLEGLQFDQRHLLEGHGIVIGRGWVRHATFSLWYGLGWPVLIAAVAGLLVLARRSWRMAVLVGVFPLAYYALVGRGYTVFVRYVTPIVPFLCIPAAVAAVQLVRWLMQRSPQWIPAAVTTAAVLMAVPSMTRVFAFDRLLLETDTRLQAAAWLAAERRPSDWFDQESVTIYSQLGQPPELRLARFDAARAAFVSPKGEPVSPDWIVIGVSPLSTYTTTSPDVLRIVESEYTLQQTFTSTTGPEPADIFDQQDAFFVPFADFSRRIRPGPEVRIYRRR